MGYPFPLQTSEGEQAQVIRQRGLLVSSSSLPRDYDDAFFKMCRDHTQVYVDSVGPPSSINCHIIKLTQFQELPIGIAASSGFPYKTLANRV